MSKDEAVGRRLQLLAAKLLDQTKQGNLHWSDTDVEEQYLYSASNSSVVVDYFQDRRYVLSLLNSRGTVVESLEMKEPSEAASSDDVALFGVLEALYEHARRQALRIDQIIDELLRDVDRGFTDKNPKNPFDEEPPF